jgi:5-methylcytosine-specific restriction endonuclease McrA
MVKYKEVYLKAFNLTRDEFVECEVCKGQAVEIHHLDCKGMGGSKEKDTIDNLMAVCRECHVKYGDKKQYKDLLQEIHNKVLEDNCITVS